MGVICGGNFVVFSVGMGIYVVMFLTCFGVDQQPTQ
jgi:hypothetical protein